MENKQIQISDLLVLGAPCEQRPFVYPRKTDLLCPHEKCLRVLTTNPPLEFAFSLKTSDRGCNLCGRLGKQTSGNFSVYDISWPTPSMSLSVPSCSLGKHNQIIFLCLQNTSIYIFIKTIITLFLWSNRPTKLIRTSLG